MRPLFRANPWKLELGSARSLLAILHPREWDGLYWLLLVLAGIGAALFVSGSWIIHFWQTGQWWWSVTIALGAGLMIGGARARIPLAAFCVAVAIGVGTALFSGGLDVLLP